MINSDNGHWIKNLINIDIHFHSKYVRTLHSVKKTVRNKRLAKFLQSFVRTHHFLALRWRRRGWMGAILFAQSKIGRRRTDNRERRVRATTQPESGALSQRDRKLFRFLYACGDRPFKRTRAHTGGGKRFWLRALLMKWKFFAVANAYRQLFLARTRELLLLMSAEYASEPARRKVCARSCGRRTTVLHAQLTQFELARKICYVVFFVHPLYVSRSIIKGGFNYRGTVIFEGGIF